MKEGWEVKKFSDVFDLQMGKTPSRDNVEYWGDENCWVAISDIKEKYISDTKEYITNKAVLESKIKKVIAGTVIMSFKLTVGRTAITKVDLYTNEAIMAFNLKSNYDVLPEYTYYYLKAYKWEGGNKAVMGITLNKASISANKFVIPPLPEQSRIVEELDLLSNIIEKKRQQLSELDNLAQSIFYDMFGDPVTNEKGWEVKKLSETSNIISGFAFNSTDFSSKNTIKAIKITNVGVNEFIEDDISLPSKYIDKHNYMVKAGDVVIALTRTVISTGLKRAIVPVNYDGALVNQRVAAIVVDENVIYKSFLYNYLGTDFVKEYVLKHALALMQPNLSVNDLKNIPIYYPPLSLQQLFAQKIEAIEKEKELIKQSIKATEELFNSRMDYYFI